MACTCVNTDSLDEETFKRYPFVAHVSVAKVEEFNGPFESRTSAWLNDTRLVSFSVLELYRGEMISLAVETDHSSSCGTFISEGEELIIYAHFDRDRGLSIQGCTPTGRYRDSNGVKILSNAYGYPTHLKYWLDSYCRVLPTGVTTKGISEYVHHYQNGQLEERTEYKDGLRHGSSVHYYPNGVIMDERHYYEGKPTGLRRYYLDDGTLNFELEYNFRGDLVRQTNYYKGYDDLRHETLYTPEAELEKDFAFRENGTLAKMIMRRNWDNLEEKYYNESGKLIHHLAYYEDGVATVLIDSLAVER